MKLSLQCVPVSLHEPSDLLFTLPPVGGAVREARVHGLTHQSQPLLQSLFPEQKTSKQSGRQHNDTQRACSHGAVRILDVSISADSHSSLFLCRPGSNICAQMYVFRVCPCPLNDPDVDINSNLFFHPLRI